MREIKFRAWDANTNKMYEHVTINRKGEVDFCYNGVNGIVKDFPGYTSEGVKYESFIPMQYTGLKDKNGKEIYEGDILKVPDWYEVPENTYQTYSNYKVGFKNGSFYFGTDAMASDYEYIEEECEIIGNIYENPELLS